MDIFSEGSAKVNFKTTVGFNSTQINHHNTINENHPENPARIETIRRILDKSNTLKDCNVIEQWPSIDVNDLKLTHHEAYVSSVLKTLNYDQDGLNNYCSQYDSVFLSPGSTEAAMEGVSCCRTLVEMIMEEKIPNGFAIVRPPGHHADSSNANGFCIFNNAAQAAEAAFNFGADRILIVDFDVHHGQGTQRIFYEDRRILYISVHRHEHGKFWPHLPESNFDYIGEGEGRGYNVNIPLNETGCGDSDYLAIFWNVIWPIASDFNPNIIIVSAGFDSLDGDPLGEMKLTPVGYSHLIYQLKALAKGKLLLILEGGYNHRGSAVAVDTCLSVLKGAAPQKLTDLTAPKASTVKSCLNVISVHRNFWPGLAFYKNRSGRNWEIHSSDASFMDTPNDIRVNTGNIQQDDLMYYDCDGISDSNNKTILFYNKNDNLHFNVEDDEHPERPARTERIMETLAIDGLTVLCDTVVNNRSASQSELELAHDRPNIESLKRTQNMTNEELRSHEQELDSIFLTKDSFNTASKAAGAVLECVDRLYNGGPAVSSNAFAVIRPPGHHAGIAKPSGFCLFNNVGVATQYAKDKYGAEKVLIVDWDVHHGNGTQEIFYEDNQVLYVSLHRHEGGMFYPVGEPKDFMDVGENKGEGFTVNIPFSGAAMGDREYEAAFTKILMPIAYEFNPDLVFISAGFDAAKGDPLGEYKVTPEMFGLMTHFLNGLAGGNLITVLEGGYNIESISACSSVVCETILNRGLKRYFLDPTEPKTKHTHPEAWTSIRKSAFTQQRYWKMLNGFQLPIEYILEEDQSDDESEKIEEDEMAHSSHTVDFDEDANSNFGALHAVVPLTTCPHLTEVKPVPDTGIEAQTTCSACGIGAEVWICLSCYQGHCGRHVHEHALHHHLSSSHPMALSLADLSVWCYPCDSYVHNDVLIPSKNSAHKSKFGEDMPH